MISTNTDAPMPTVLREHFGRIVGTTPQAYRRCA
jgi:hypothetical protein